MIKKELPKAEEVREESKTGESAKKELTIEEIKKAAEGNEVKEEQKPVPEKTIRQIKEDALRKRLLEKEKEEKKDE